MYRFEKKDNPLVSLGVGKKALIEKWLNDMCIKNYVLNNDLTIDVDGSVDIQFRNLTEKFPDYIQFNIINGNFHCQYNKLTSLEGFPKTIKGNFYCGKNAIQFTEKYIKKKCKVSGTIYPYTYDGYEYLSNLK